MPKIGYQKRDFTSKPVRQQPRHSPGPFTLGDNAEQSKLINASLKHAAVDAQWLIHDKNNYVVCLTSMKANRAEINMRWLLDLMNKAHNVESNIAANNAALSKPMKVIP